MEAMNIWTRLSLSLVSLFTLTALTFGLVAPAAYAQDAQQEIQSGLCGGADLKLEGGDCSTTSSGVERLNKGIHSLINVLSLIVGLAAVVMIIIGGLRYITSGGSDTSVTSAKNTILYAIIGLIIVALAQVMVRFVLKQVTQ